MADAQPAVFLDRDGTLIEDTGYLREASAIRILPTVPAALQRFERANYQRIVITNQSGVARGLFPETTVTQIGTALDRLLATQGASLNGLYYCPHLESGCTCRKPLPGLILRAAAEQHIDLTRSVMIGDRGSDIAAGHAAGIPGVLVTTGGRTYDGPKPDAIVPTLFDAAEWVLRHVS